MCVCVYTCKRLCACACTPACIMKAATGVAACDTARHQKLGARTSMQSGLSHGQGSKPHRLHKPSMVLVCRQDIRGLDPGVFGGVPPPGRVPENRPHPGGLQRPVLVPDRRQHPVQIGGRCARARVLCRAAQHRPPQQHGAYGLALPPLVSLLLMWLRVCCSMDGV